MNELIELENVTFHYKNSQAVIKDIKMKFEKDQKLCVLGRSGCGKTTLLLLLAGILKPEKGKIYIHKKELIGMRPETGIIFQDGGLFLWKTVYGNLAIGLKARKLTKKQIDTKVNKVLTDLDILHLKNKYIKDISGGQKQRVAIARTLVLDSDTLLFDEPSSSLDAMTKDNFQRLMLDIYDHYKLCSVVVTHDIEEAVYLGQTILIMKDGRIASIMDNNDLFGKKDAKQALPFYERCIEIRKRME